MIGREQLPEMGDQTRMPFTVAVIHEVQRFGDIVPLGVPHMTSRDTEVQGFLIPKVGLQASLCRGHSLMLGVGGSWGDGEESRGWASPAPCPFRADRPLGKTG